MGKIVEKMAAKLKTFQDKCLEYGEKLKLHLEQGAQVMIMQNSQADLQN